MAQPTLYQWIKKFRMLELERIDLQGQAAEIMKHKAELRRETKERDILKKPR